MFLRTVKFCVVGATARFVQQPIVKWNETKQEVKIENKQVDLDNTKFYKRFWSNFLTKMHQIENSPSSYPPNKKTIINSKLYNCIKVGLPFFKEFIQLNLKKIKFYYK